jgi:predicted dehydrogenase
MAGERRIVRVGLVGCGEVAQTIHIPTLNHFSEFFRITYLCDTSESATRHAETKVAGAARPRLTKDAAEVCSSPEVDVVFVINANEL